MLRQRLRGGYPHAGGVMHGTEPAPSDTMPSVSLALSRLAGGTGRASPRRACWRCGTREAVEMLAVCAALDGAVRYHSPRLASPGREARQGPHRRATAPGRRPAAGPGNLPASWPRAGSFSRPGCTHTRARAHTPTHTPRRLVRFLAANTLIRRPLAVSRREVVQGRRGRSG